MKALLCKRHGPPDTLSYEDVPDPIAGEGEVLIDIRAAGVNFPDVLIIQNLYQTKPPLPFAPGAELAGVVSAVGPGVSDRKVGDRVIGSSTWGAFAERIALPVARTLPMPQTLDFEQASAFVLTYGTSYHALIDRGALKAGETVLILGAAGGVGLAAIQIARAIGARVIAAASSAEKLALCAQHGADGLINYAEEDLRERVAALTGGRGPEVVYDPVGGAFAEPAFRSIGWRGRYLVVGFANGEIPRLPLNLALLKGASIVGVFWGRYMQTEPDRFASDIEVLTRWLDQGLIRPHVSARYRLEDGARALEDLVARKVTGKIVLIP
jgi:NADPH2:quinone reductase